MPSWRTLLVCGLALFSGAACSDMAAVTPAPETPASALTLPPGFKLNVYAELPPAGGDYFRGPRFMAFSPDGQLYLSLGRDNKVVMLPDRNRDGRADEVVTVADKLNAPQGLAFVDGTLLVANQDGVLRIDQNRVTPFISQLPDGGHTLKTLRLGPDGFLYLNVGSSCNVCEESDPLRATMLRYTRDGKPAGALKTLGRHAQSPIWAQGLRNSQGFAWQPGTGAMFATNNGSDMRSDKHGGKPVDDLPPEHLNRIEAGKHYGWPHCWGNRHTDPNFPGPAGFCAGTEPAALTLPAHSTPIGIAFVNTPALPAEYQGDALVALHGSWNRAQPSGYKVVRIHFKDGQPVSTSDFISGWLGQDGAWGRPVDVLFGPDGALFISDDRAGRVYRVVYTGVKK